MNGFGLRVLQGRVERVAVLFRFLFRLLFPFGRREGDITHAIQIIILLI